MARFWQDERLQGRAREREREREESELQQITHPWRQHSSAEHEKVSGD